MKPTIQDAPTTTSTAPGPAVRPVRPWRLFPHPVARISGLPYEALERLRVPEAMTLLDEAEAHRTIMARLAEELAPALYELIGATEDGEVRRRLLKLRRNLHNLRRVSRSLLEDLGDHLPRTVIADCARYHSHGAARSAARERARSRFEDALPTIRRELQRAARVDDFLGALALSSPTLSRRLGRYLACDPDRPGAKARQIERSLLRYLSRAATKTTPFSTFCAIGPARLEVRGVGSREAAILGDPARKSRQVRINKAFFGALIPALERCDAIRGRLGVELNSTLTRQADAWRFLAAREGREVFQKLRPLPSLDVLRELLEAGPLSHAELVGHLAGDPRLDADATQATAFVDRLLDIGLLRWRTGIREQEAEWDRPLLELLEGIEDPVADRIRSQTRLLRERAEALPQASPGRRVQLVSRTEDELAELFEALGLEPPAGEQPPFYEDAAAEAVLSLPSAGLAPAVGHLAELVDLLAPLASPRLEQLRMGCFFATHYGEGHGPVPLLRFYEDYYREHFKAHLELEARIGRGEAPAAGEERPPRERLIDPFDQESVAALRRAVNRLQGLVARRWRQEPEAEEISLERDDLLRCLEGVDPLAEGAAAACRSVSIFAQVAPYSRLRPGRATPGELALVTDGWFAGYGKYVSRFLYLLPDEIRERLREGNRGISRARLAEICGNAHFNGNLHPPLLPWEISNPTGETSAASDRIAVTELTVGPDPDRPGELRLLQGSGGTRVLPVDLGFLNPLMRPPLFQLLASFTPAGPLNPVPLPARRALDDSPDGASEPDRCLIRPRITYRGRVVLARRRWEIDAAQFPTRRSESEGQYLGRLDDWRRELGLPERCFFRVHAEQVAEGPGTGAPRQHLYKPQFLDFSSPLLLDLFSRVAGNLERFRISFEEALPDPAAAPVGAGKRWASEVILQLDYPEAGPGDGDD